MRPLGCPWRAQSDVKAEFAEFSSKTGGKTGPVGAFEMNRPKVGTSHASPEHPIGGRAEGGSDRNVGLAPTTSALRRSNRARR
jgi:hypothetical protein